MDWIDRFTLKIITRPPLFPLRNFEMTENELAAAWRLRDAGLVRRRLGFWLATDKGREKLSAIKAAQGIER